ncbi:MAG: NUDIX hydrolase [Candidatus Muproteobacteria bacterium RBG_16_62_13]|uniref:NUDIX hydrolase n=1 Tax=Candidatus Muproteobacteria bacterium RBG_16_62_13 TaxID=1817756 RepID=A0A1F6T0X2_9PROT|nr:MAG: NUDIX hydrolase [Candidatus Muproteobacteria bacterium RBG_16_62_13]
MAIPRTPALTTDIVIELTDRPGRPIVLIERRNPPYGLAFPGGFVDVGEAVEQAAMREAREETGLAVTLVALLGVYSDPARDPRSHTCSVVYVARASGAPVAEDDAKAVHVIDPAAPPGRLVFDHEQILSDYLSYRKSGAVPAPRR